MDEFASVTEDLNILSKSITVESTPPNAFFSKLEVKYYLLFDFVTFLEK